MKKLFILAFTLMATISSTAQLITIQTDAAEGALPIVTAHTASPIVYDAENDHTVVRLAATAVAKDIESITGMRPAVSTTLTAGSTPIIAGTIGQSSHIDALIANGKLDASAITDK